MAPDQSASPALAKAIAGHRIAYRAYDRLIPRADPYDPRFIPATARRIGKYQRREAGRRKQLLSHAVASLADGRAKAEYLLGYGGDSYLVGDEEELVLFLRAFISAEADDS